MEACLYDPSVLFPPVRRQGGPLARLLAAIHGFFAAEPPAEASAAVPDHAALSRQAERMLTDHGDSILRLAYSYLHNKSDAEDILQDTLIQFLRTAPVLENARHEKAWLLTVAANLSKNKIQAQKLRQTDELSEMLAAEPREDLSYVWEAVKALPLACREAVHLFYQEGYTTAEIGRILGRNESTVRSDLRRGRIRLREILQEGYGFAGCV